MSWVQVPSLAPIPALCQRSVRQHPLGIGEPVAAKTARRGSVLPFDFHRIENIRVDLRLQMIATARRLKSLSRWPIRALTVLFLLAVLGPLARAGDWEDGYASYMGGDYATAFGLFMSAAEQGSVQAMDMLSLMYRNGEGVAPNYAEADLWAERAKAQRSSNAIEKVQGTNNAGSNK